MSWAHLLTIVGSVASIFGAFVAVNSAIKSASAKDAAETARDEAVNGMAGHHRAEALSEARHVANAAISALNPFYGTGTVESKGASVDEALKKLGDFTIKLESASLHFPSGQKSINKANRIVRKIDEYVSEFRAENDQATKNKTMNLIFAETRSALKLLEGELNESRQNN